MTKDREVIETLLQAAAKAEADFAVVRYDPQTEAEIQQVDDIREAARKMAEARFRFCWAIEQGL